MVGADEVAEGDVMGVEVCWSGEEGGGRRRRRFAITTTTTTTITGAAAAADNATIESASSTAISWHYW